MLSVLSPILIPGFCPDEFTAKVSMQRKTSSSTSNLKLNHICVVIFFPTFLGNRSQYQLREKSFKYFYRQEQQSLQIRNSNKQRLCYLNPLNSSSCYDLYAMKRDDEMLLTVVPHLLQEDFLQFFTGTEKKKQKEKSKLRSIKRCKYDISHGTWSIMQPWIKEKPGLFHSSRKPFMLFKN